MQNPLPHILANPLPHVPASQHHHLHFTRANIYTKVPVFWEVILAVVLFPPSTLANIKQIDNLEFS
jgi:hypothetical protein